MDKRDQLLMKKQQLEQLIQNKQDTSTSGLWNDELSLYASHPADISSHLQLLNIELERINAALDKNNFNQLS